MALAVGPWIGALGIFLQVVTGYPKAPSGIPILAVVGLLCTSAARWAWIAVVALFFVGLIWIGSLPPLSADL